MYSKPISSYLDRDVIELNVSFDICNFSSTSTKVSKISSARDVIELNVSFDICNFSSTSTKVSKTSSGVMYTGSFIVEN